MKYLVVSGDVDDEIDLFDAEDYDDRRHAEDRARTLSRRPGACAYRVIRLIECAVYQPPAGGAR